MTTQTPADAPREALRELVGRFGRELASDPPRVSGLMRDVAGNYRLEISLLVVAAEEGIPESLIRDTARLTTARVGTLAARLESSKGLSEANAHWATEAWAYALSLEISAPGVPAAGTLPGAPPAAPDLITVVPPPPPITRTSASDSEALSPPTLSVDETVRSAGAVVAGAAAATTPPGQTPAPAPPLPAGGPPGRSSDPRRRKVLAVSIAAVVVVAFAISIPLALSRNGDASPSPGAGVSLQPGTATSTSSSPPPSPGVGSPTNLHVAASSPSFVQLAWTAPAHGGKVAHYEIFRNDKKIGSTKQRTYSDQKVDPGANYTYRVEAVGTDGSTAKSSPRHFSVPTPAPPVTHSTAPPTTAPPSCSASNPSPCTPTTCSAAGGQWIPGDQRCVF